MQIIKQELPHSCNILLWGDDHWGSAFRSNDACDEFMSLSNSKIEGVKKNYIVHHGDIIEGILLDDPRASVETTQQPFMLRQVDMAVEYWSRLKGKLITMLDGNHPMKLWRYGNITSDICNRIGTTYGTYTAIINYVSEKTGNLMFKQFATHGAKTFKSCADDIIRRKTNIKLAIKHSARDKISDCYLMSCGHSHLLEVVDPEPRLILGCNDNTIVQNYTSKIDYHTQYPIPEDQRYYVNTGSAVRLYIPNSGLTSYAERFGYDPIEMGCAVVVVRDGKIKGIRKHVFSI